MQSLVIHDGYTYQYIVTFYVIGASKGTRAARGLVPLEHPCAPRTYAVVRRWPVVWPRHPTSIQPFGFHLSPIWGTTVWVSLWSASSALGLARLNSLCFHSGGQG